MKFVEIVEIVEDIESKLGTLSESKLDLIETILEEGTDIEFDIVHHLDYLVEFVETQTDENAKIIAETVDGSKILNIILESARKNASKPELIIEEALDNIENIDIEFLEEDETASVTLLSIVTNKLTEMLGEETVESLPAEMVFDIVEAAKDLDLDDSVETMDLVETVEEISNKLEKAINEGVIDFDSEDYEGESLMEFLDDYEDTEDLLEEMAQVNEEILAEAEDEDGANLLRKAKGATVLIEKKLTRCKPGDVQCAQKKAKDAKKYYMKNPKLHGGEDIKDLSMDKLTGKLRKHVKKAAKAHKQATGKAYSDEYLQFVLIPGILKHMRNKGKHMKASSKILK